MIGAVPGQMSQPDFAGWRVRKSRPVRIMILFKKSPKWRFFGAY